MAPTRDPGAAPRRVLLFLFFASGFASLTMEMVWARQLSQLAGSGMRASAGVASIMLAGLAAGALLAAPAADRLKRPLRAYALAELGVGAWALATPHLLPRLQDLAVSAPGELAHAADLGWGSLLAIIILVLPGSLLMGATTPLVVRADVAFAPGAPRAGRAGGSLGRLYGCNTLGGAAGALSAAFLLLPSLGLRASLSLAAAVSLAVAALAWRFAAAGGPAPGTEAFVEVDPAPRPPRPSIPASWLLLGVLLIAGGIAMVCQVAWTRVLVLLFGSSVQALGLTLAFALLGLAAGSAACAAALGRGANPLSLSTWLLASASILTLLTIPAWGWLPVAVVMGQAWLGTSFGGALALQSAFSALLMIPPAAALGALLPALTAAGARGRDHPGRDAGAGYGIDSAGSVLGGLTAAFLLLPRFGASDLLRGSALAEALMLVLLVLLRRRAGAGRGVAVGLAVAGSLITGTLLCPRWDPALLTSGPLLYGSAYLRVGGAGGAGIRAAMLARGELIFLEEGPDATVTVRRSPGGSLSLQINGKTDASDGADLPSQILAGALPALLHPDPSRALVIGLATGTTDFAVAARGVTRLDGVELSPSVARAAVKFQSANGGILEDPRFHLTIADGRAWLQHSAARYDLIVSQPTNPWVAGVTNLFTREFFLLARSRLRPGGILAVWVQGYAMSPRDVRSIVATFQEAFPQAQLWEESPGGGDYFLIGGGGGRGASLADLLERLDAPGVLRSMFARAGAEDLPGILSRFIASGTALKKFAGGAPVISDDNIRLEYSAPREIWNNQIRELLASLEAVREEPSSLFPELATPAHFTLREALRGLQRGRRDRMRLALSLRRADLAALSSPSLAAAARFLREGRSEPAIPFLRRARDEAPDSPVIPTLLGWTLMRLGKHAEAEEWFHKARAQDPESPAILEGLGLCAFHLGRVAHSEELFRRASRLAPDDPDPLSNLGAALLSLDRVAEALQVLDRAVQLDPSHVGARVNRGVALARLGRIREAVGDYTRALALDPDHEDARFNLQAAQERLRNEGPTRRP